MIKQILGIAAIFSLSGLAACSGPKTFSEIEALNNSSPSGSPFTQRLTQEYKVFANFLLDAERDYVDAMHFARKGLYAADGAIIMPEPMDDWDLFSDQYQELSQARGRLMAMYELGAIDQMPVVTAVAQSRFDCWIEAEEEANQSDIPFVIPCKAQFFEALAQLENNIRRPAPQARPEPAQVLEPAFPEPIEPVTNYSDQPVAIADAVYLVFFDFDRSNITSGAQDVVETVAAEILSRNLNGVNIVGHTDSSGSDLYNRALGNRRANAVKQALISQGVPADMISTASRGENELLVQTADGVKEPANRRATITFR